MRNVDIEYEEVPLETVINYFAKGFTPQKGEIIKKDYFVDVHKNVVVFRLFVKRPTQRAVDVAIAPVCNCAAANVLHEKTCPVAKSQRN